jgi:hypothetical protein
MTSNREKKRSAKEGAERLRARPGWDPAQHKREAPSQALARLKSEENTRSAFARAEECPDCAQSRAQEQDESALCPAHLKAALGC